MFSIRADDIYEVVKPVHCCSQILGLTSFSILQVSKRKYKAVVTFYNILCIIISTCWNSFILWFYASGSGDWKLNQEYISEFYEHCSKINLICNISLVVFTNWWLIFKRDKFIALLDSIQNGDEILMHLDINLSFGKQKKISIVVLIILKIIAVVGTVVSYATTKLTEIFTPSLITSVADYINVTFLVLMFAQFMLFMWVIKERYKHINQMLYKIYLDNYSNVAKSHSKKLADLTALSIVHDKLVDTSELLSFCYGVPVSAYHVLRINIILEF